MRINRSPIRIIRSLVRLIRRPIRLNRRMIRIGGRILLINPNPLPLRRASRVTLGYRRKSHIRKVSTTLRRRQVTMGKENEKFSF